MPGPAGEGLSPPGQGPAETPGDVPLSNGTGRAVTREASSLDTNQVTNAIPDSLGDRDGFQHKSRLGHSQVRLTSAHGAPLFSNKTTENLLQMFLKSGAGLVLLLQERAATAACEAEEESGLARSLLNTNL